jgi:undecaprenyl-diphosphatase
MVELLILGLVQGLTEFLPVSSSGHLVILSKIFGLSEQIIAITLVLHLGTCLSLLVFFFRDILKLFRSVKLIYLVAIVTVVTGTIGISGKKFFEALFFSPRAVALGWLITAAVLLATKKFMGAKREHPNIKDAVILGLVQGIAIVPGISRSGVTVSALLFRKIDKITAFRFSFLAAIPAIFGAAFLESKKINFAVKMNWLGLGGGFLISFASGLFALWFLEQSIKKARLHYFAYYCAVIAVLTLLFIQ